MRPPDWILGLGAGCAYEGGGSGDADMNPGLALPLLEGGSNTCETAERRGDLH